MDKSNVGQSDKVQLQQQIIYFKSELVKYMKKVEKLENNYQVNMMKALEEKYDNALAKNETLEKSNRALFQEKQTCRKQLTEKDKLLEKMKEHLHSTQSELNRLKEEMNSSEKRDPEGDEEENQVAKTEIATEDNEESEVVPLAKKYDQFFQSYQASFREEESKNSAKKKN
ncbi:hypothetical protein CR203_10235 [Salipaludibacillus neizhouensis]|uniref:Uncharacterized protein n=1 Tax=Salipaludibacillus neizhouensis TaxID=885475 RepID=A0A3A9KJ13_9BACI|nr:hypothetical protein [Salipaludibacillus neizhouensis]RKL67715.1 hypothetical protein CR203_10235 [Salipaludibacillus neizhouensis]